MSNWSSLEDLYKLYHSEIYYYLLKMCKRKEVAQDLAQDTFIKAFNGLSSFKGSSSVKTWLYTIAYNTFVNWYRREAKIVHESFESHEMFKSFEKTPEEAVTQKSSQQELLNMIMTLKEEYQHVIILREYQELTYEEIAEILDWKLSKVKTNLHRAKLALKQSLNKSVGETYEL